MLVTALPVIEVAALVLPVVAVSVAVVVPAPDLAEVRGDAAEESHQILLGIDRFRLRSKEEVPDAIPPHDDGETEPARVVLHDPLDQGSGVSDTR